MEVQSLNPKVVLSPELRSSAKNKRYELCLEFIGTILQDFEIDSNEENQKTLSFLGDVACGIDTALDLLPYEEKEEVYWSFTDLYHRLLGAEDLPHFDILCSTFISSKLKTRIPAPDSPLLFKLVCEAKALKIERELHQFAMKTIHASLSKQSASSVDELLSAIKLEGESAVDFLLFYLDKKSMLGQNNSRRLKAYLIQLERMLNLADDLLDSKADHKKGIIKLNINLRFYFKMTRTFAAHFIKTWFQFPVIFTKHCLRFSSKSLMLEWKMK
ncbi:hypothetical protein GYB22_06000 [bacterium]|nr:hypothetical protein [bacterium]